MKILLGCLNANDLGGSELYHYELARELKALGADITLFTLRGINKDSEVRNKLTSLGIPQVDPYSLNIKESFDIIISSQPAPTRYLISNFPNHPFVNIIHSEIRSETPLFHSAIKHYIAIRQPIEDFLTKEYHLEKSKVSLIYNPIDQSRFNVENKVPLEKYTGLFVGEVLDSIRSKPVHHLVGHCIAQDWDLLLMSETFHDFNHPNIRYVEKRWDTESILKQVNFTAGILLGRTTLESRCCEIPSFMYIIDVFGNIQRIETDVPTDIVKFCDSRYVAEQHLSLYKKLI